MSEPTRIGRPAGADGEQTRRRIMAVAIMHIARVGYGNATMKSIAEEAGLTSAAIYHYFDSKEELAVAILESLVDEAMHRLEHAAQIEGSLSRRFTALLEEALVLARDYPSMARFSGNLVGESARHSAFGAVFRRRRAIEQKLLRRLVDESVDDGELPADTDRQALVDMFASITAGLTELSAVASPARHRAAIKAMETLLSAAADGARA